MGKYSIGLDFGTNSCRALIVNINTGQEIAEDVFEYPSGDCGIITDVKDHNLARQNPADYIQGIEVTIGESLRKAKKEDSEFNPDKIIGIGVDTTGSSPMPVDNNGTPLCFLERFKNIPGCNGMVMERSYKSC